MPRRQTAAADYAPFGCLAPYFDRLCFRPETPAVSSEPRMMWYRMPGRSFTRPPRMRTIECSCRLCPTPGMYDVTSRPLVRRTRATFRSAEFGFLGVVVYTRMHTPRFCGQASMAGVLDFFGTASRPRRTSWLMVGMAPRAPYWSVNGAKTLTLYPNWLSMSIKRPAVPGRGLEPPPPGPQSSTRPGRPARPRH